MKRYNICNSPNQQINLLAILLINCQFDSKMSTKKIKTLKQSGSSQLSPEKLQKAVSYKVPIAEEQDSLSESSDRTEHHQVLQRTHSPDYVIQDTVSEMTVRGGWKGEAFEEDGKLETQSTYKTFIGGQNGGYVEQEKLIRSQTELTDTDWKAEVNIAEDGPNRYVHSKEADIEIDKLEKYQSVLKTDRASNQKIQDFTSHIEDEISSYNKWNYLLSLIILLQFAFIGYLYVQYVDIEQVTAYTVACPARVFSTLQSLASSQI